MSTPNTVPLTYNGYVSQVANMAVLQVTTVSNVVQGVDATFNTMLPQALNYAELRIQRDLDLLPSLTSNTYSITSGTSTLQISSNDFVTIKTISINGTPLLPVSQEYIQNVWGGSSTQGPPTIFAMIGGDQSTGGNTYNNILLGPSADQSYSVAVFGTQRLPSLNQMGTPSLAASGTTFISTYYPDLLVMASMIYVSAFQRNFSATANDPQMPVNYETQYQTLLKGSLNEEGRKRFAGPEWTSQSAQPAASIPR